MKRWEFGNKVEGIAQRDVMSAEKRRWPSQEGEQEENERALCIPEMREWKSPNNEKKKDFKKGIGIFLHE